MLLKLSLASALVLAVLVFIGESTPQQGTCLYKWLLRAGISAAKSRRYEKSLRIARVSEKSLRLPVMSPFLLGVMMQYDFNAASAFKKCIIGKSKHCRGYNPCQRRGECVFSSKLRANTCKCRKGLYGNFCLKDCNECTKEKPSGCKGLHPNCHANGECLNTHGSFRCACQKGFKGNGRTCININECLERKAVPCHRHANCKDTVGSYSCTCKPGYQGNGKVCRPICECCSNPCQNGGKCIEQINRYSCHCSVGHEGTHCEKRWLQIHRHKPLPEIVQNISKAVQALTDDVKDLTNGMKEVRNTVKKIAEDDCKPNPCKNRGRCVDQQNGFLCLCQRGFTGRTCLSGIGQTSSLPGKSCQHLFSAGRINSGMYWIRPAGKAPIKVYCDMSAGGGWMRVADIDAKRRGCPGNLQLISAAGGRITVCALKSGPGCSSTKFSTHNVPYSKVRGFAYGHQYYTPDAFDAGGSIDSHYVEGVSITHGSPRKHIWTFAVGLTQDESGYNSRYNCPCARYPGPSPPSFVGKDYYCESGAKRCCTRGWFSERLWDGHCFSKSKCCNRSGMPFFVKDLRRLVTDPLEVRLCLDQETGNENVGVEKLELFVR